uniref:Uncharacterized protein n=1 Tax=Oryzias latipes TaxID=8090 RepID=A0A3P9M5Y8_ORYLA
MGPPPPRVFICLWSALLLLCALTLFLWYYETGPQIHSQSEPTVMPTMPEWTPRVKRFLVDPIDHQDNYWFQTVNLTASSYNVTDCYVCSFVPHHARHNPTITPRPVSMFKTLMFFVEFTSAYSSIGVKRLFPGVNISNLRGLALNRWPETAPFCIRSNCNDRSTHFLGRSHCKDVVVVPGSNLSVASLGGMHWSYDASMISKHNPLPHALIFNYTAIGIRAGLRTPASIPAALTYVPGPQGFPCPPEYVWTCGLNTYLWLPADWCGTCYLAEIIPASLVFQKSDPDTASSIDHLSRRRRDSTHYERPPAIGTGKTVAMALFPSYGVVVLRNAVNDLYWSLDNLTASLLHLTEFLHEDPERKAMTTMILQNRMALDFILAERGGVCALIHDYCCTFIPSSSANLTHIINEVKTLKSHISSQMTDTYWSDSPLTWFTSGPWWSVLVKLVTPVLCVLLLFFLLVTCVFPCIRSMVDKALSGRATYVNTLYQHYAYNSPGPNPSMVDTGF